ncbi:site-specific integrase [Vibrio kyushuensis]|uniref:site-specific integrase n=1 Tax=Vibrio kyushuensis TaxID=2910249 RepID=UPI003D0A2854
MTNHTKGIDRHVPTRSRAPKRLTDTKIIINEVSEINPMVGFMIHMQYLTGLRFSDVRETQTSDFADRFGDRDEFDVVQNKIYNATLTRIKNHETKSQWPIEKQMSVAKSKARHTVFITEAVRDLFNEVMDFQEYNNPYFNGHDLFSSASPRSSGKPYRKEYANKLLKSPELTQRLRPHGITNRHLGTHSFRKAPSQELLANKVHVRMIMDFLGQTSLESTLKYIESNEEEMRQSVALIGTLAKG